MNIFKKFKLFFTYRKLVSKYKQELLVTHNLRMDYVYRLYTVLNLPDDVKSYGAKLGKVYIDEYIRKIDQSLVEYGLSELIGIRDLKKLEGDNVLIIIGFKFFDTKRIANISVVLIILSIIFTILIKLL